MKTLNSILITAMSLLILMSCGGGHDAHTTEEAPAIKVEVGTAASASGEEKVTASGTIRAQSSANISTRMMGNVANLHVKVGEKVRAGQSLITLHNTDLIAKRSQVEAKIRQARSAVKNAEKDYNRFKNLFDKGSASEKELDDMTTRYEMARANLEAARQMKKEVEAQFAYTNIRAPFAGIVANTFVKEGDMANPGMPLVTVEGTAGYEATVFVSESNINKIEKGADAMVTIKSMDKTLKGEVAEVSLSAKNTGGQYLVTIDLGEANEKVLPGMFVNASFEASTEKGVTANAMIPKKALTTKGQLTGIYCMGEDKKAILRWLRLGKSNGDQVEVLSGLKPGEKFILSAESRLFNGARVQF